MVYNSCPAIRIYSRILNPFCRHLALSFLVPSSKNLIILNSYHKQLGLSKRIYRRGSRRNPFQDFQEGQEGCPLEISNLNRFWLAGEDFRIDALPSPGIDRDRIGRNSKSTLHTQQTLPSFQTLALILRGFHNKPYGGQFKWTPDALKITVLKAQTLTS